MSIFNHLFGMLMPGAASRRDEPAPATPPMQIPGARSAQQLAMLCTDGVLPKGPADWLDPKTMRPERRHVQLKADGIRAIYIDGRIVTREGAPLDCALHCQPGLQRMIEKCEGIPMVIDGEYVAQDGFAATIQEHKRKKGEGVFWAFDCLPLEHWQRGGSPWPIEDRLAILRDMIVNHNDSLFVGMLDAWFLTPEETAAKVREIWAAGGEGVVSKTAGSPYVRERSADWLRLTETHIARGPIVDMMTKKDGTLKNIVVNVLDRTSPKPMTVVVGNGWSAAEGRTLLAMHQGAYTEHSMWAEVSFKLTTGASRQVRGARFRTVVER